jgi:hypothetical protein
MDVEIYINDFAIRSFRDIGDEDYICARMGFRAALVEPSLWASQQALEKYLKCILLLNRIPGKHVKHELKRAIDAIKVSGKVNLKLTDSTLNFIKQLDEFGRFRYLGVSNFASGRHLIMLDRAVWELRRFCTLNDGPRQIKLQQGKIPTKVRINGGYLENVLDNVNNPGREPLLWQNAFFGKRQRRQVKINRWTRASNAPLYLNPQMLNEILKYVHLPRNLNTNNRLCA